MGIVDAAFLEHDTVFNHPRTAAAALFARPAVFPEAGFMPVGAGKPCAQAFLEIEKVAFYVIKVLMSHGVLLGD
jgi:hypothetical protein